MWFMVKAISDKIAKESFVITMLSVEGCHSDQTTELFFAQRVQPQALNTLYLVNMMSTCTSEQKSTS